MGSSKKHKDKDKEHKKKRKHKDRSRSRSKERKHKKDKKHSCEQDFEESEAKRYKRDTHYKKDYEYGDEDIHEFQREFNSDGGAASYQSPVKPEPLDIPAPSKSSGDISLSIEDTNRLRAKLGMKPLEGTGSSTQKSGAPETGKQEDVHLPAKNISNIQKQEKLRETLLQAKEKRRINKILGYGC